MMGPVATAAKHLIAAGVTGDALVTALAEIEAALPVPSPAPVDEQAERRRAKDRERKAVERLRKSAESADAPPAPPSNPPGPPNTSPLTPRSDASASGGEPPLPDPSKVMFDHGIRLLGMAAVPEGKARGLIGKWKRDHGEEAVIAALGRAQREGAVDPVAFIEGGWRATRRREAELDRLPH